MINKSWQKNNLHHQDSISFKKTIILNIIRIFFVIFTAFILGFVIVNYRAIYKSFAFSINSKIFNRESDLNQQLDIIVQANEEDKFENNVISIPKINVNYPIIWDSPQNKLKDNLLKGVAQLDSSDKPNQETGNIFMVGNSSLPWWQDKNKFGQSFSLLANLEKNDQININYQDNYYRYQVEDKIVVKPDQIELLQAKTNNRFLTLMTYTPIGTHLNCLIIRANLVATSEAKIKKILDIQSNDTLLPANLSSIISQ